MARSAATADTASEKQHQTDMSHAIAKLMIIGTSDMWSATQDGADDGQERRRTSDAGVWRISYTKSD